MEYQKDGPWRHRAKRLRPGDPTRLCVNSTMRGYACPKSGEFCPFLSVGRQESFLDSGRGS
jgi:hypothetical protein